MSTSASVYFSLIIDFLNVTRKRSRAEWNGGRFIDTSKSGCFILTQRSLNARYLPTYPPTHLPTYLPTHPPSYLPTHPPIYLSTHPPTHLSTHPPTHLSTHLPTYLPSSKISTVLLKCVLKIGFIFVVFLGRRLWLLQSLFVHFRTSELVAL